MRGILKAILIMLLVLLAILLLSRLAVRAGNSVVFKVVIWGAGMVFVVFAKLKWSNYKGASTILAWIAFGIFLYVTVGLAPAGAIQDHHYLLLALMTLGLVLWDRYRSS